MEHGKAVFVPDIASANGPQRHLKLGNEPRQEKRKRNRKSKEKKKRKKGKGRSARQWEIRWGKKKER
jgi:hypothetical protein